MSDEIKLLSVVAAAVVFVAIVYIRRALRHRKVIRAAIPREKTVEAIPSPEQMGKDIYLASYIYLLRDPFQSKKTVRIRPEYNEWIRQITRVIGDRSLSATAYVDKVLKAHFDNNREIINSLYQEKADKQLKTDE